MPELKTFEGCTAVVTGASMGLGAELARQLAARGASTLVLTARSEDRLQALAAELAAAHSVQTHVLALDLAAEGAALQLHEHVRRLGLDVDVLVNNAGFGKWGSFDSRPLEVARSMVALNVTALMELTYLFGLDMLGRGRGGILQVSSLTSFFTLPYVSLYTATKHFVTAFSEGLWAEWRERGVTVTTLCPGATQSAFHDSSETWKKDRKLMPAEPVCRRGLDGLLAGKPTVYASFLHSLQARLPFLFTRRRAALLFGGILRPPEGYSPGGERAASDPIAAAD